MPALRQTAARAWPGERAPRTALNVTRSARKDARARARCFSLFKDSGGKLEPVTFDAHQRSYFVPAALFDADGDGDPEVLGKDSRLAQLQNGKQRFVLDVAPPNFECGC